MTIPPPRSSDDGFVWFESPAPGAAPAPVPMDTPLPAVGPECPSAPGPEHEPVAGSAPRGPTDATLTDMTTPVVLSVALPPAEDRTEGRHGLRRRVPGAQLPATVGAPADHSVDQRSKHNAVAARSEMDDYQSAVAEAARRRDPRPTATQQANGRPPDPQLPSIGPTASRSRGAPPPRDNTSMASVPFAGRNEQRGGLTRRMPGAHLAPGLRHQPSAGPADVTSTGWEARDAEAERLAFDAFAEGFVRADASLDSAASGDGGDGHQPDQTKESTR